MDGRLLVALPAPDDLIELRGAGRDRVPRQSKIRAPASRSSIGVASRPAPISTIRRAGCSDFDLPAHAAAARRGEASDLQPGPTAVSSHVIARFRWSMNIARSAVRTSPLPHHGFEGDARDVDQLAHFSAAQQALGGVRHARSSTVESTG